MQHFYVNGCCRCCFGFLSSLPRLLCFFFFCCCCCCCCYGHVSVARRRACPGVQLTATVLEFLRETEILFSTTRFSCCCASTSSSFSFPSPFHSFSQLREDLFGVCAQKYAIMECIKHTPRAPRATQALHATKHRTKRGTSSNGSWKETSLVKEISTTLAFPQEFARARLCLPVCARVSSCVSACLKY